MSVIGLIHPGEMGASIGAAAKYNNHEVLWASIDRSGDSKKRANRGNLIDCETVANMVDRSDIIFSVCPPHAAEDVANEILRCNFTGIFVEANAIAPKRTRKIDELLRNAGATLIDGGIIGGPAWNHDASTKIYLSGDNAESIADIFLGSPLNAHVISNNIGSASALKMVFAAYTKGTTALLTAILAVAEKEGVRKNLEAQWGAEFTEKTHHQVTKNTAKAWRFKGEMSEIAATFKSAGFPEGFHEAAANIFSQLKDFKETPAKDVNEVLKILAVHD